MSTITTAGRYPQNAGVSPTEYGLLVNGPVYLEVVGAGSIAGTVQYLDGGGTWRDIPSDGREVISGDYLERINSYRGQRIAVNITSITGTAQFNRYYP